MMNLFCRVLVSMQNLGRYVLLAGLLVGGPIGLARGDIISSGHWDLALGFSGSVWTPHWHNDDEGLEAELDASVMLGIFDATATGMLAGIDAATPRPSGSNWNFTGTAVAEPLFLFPSRNPDPELPFIGIGTEEIANGIFFNNEISLAFLGIRNGPLGGQFSGFGFLGIDPIAYFSSSHPSGTIAGNVKTLETGSHEHIYWSFTQPGRYELEFNAFGHLNLPGTPYTESGRFSVTFEVANAIPEPSSLLLGLIGMTVLRARRRR